MKLILTQNEAIERLRHFLAIGADVQVIISRPRAKTPPKPKSEPVPDTRTPHRRVFEEIEKRNRVTNKIECIKILRKNFEIGLEHAKWIVEQWETERCKVIFSDGFDEVYVRNNRNRLEPLTLIPRK